jgi:hypothetical protein
MWRVTGSEPSVYTLRNLFRQHGDDESAMPWRSLENTHHAVVADKAMMRHVLWLRTERWEGVAHVSGDTCLRCERKAGVSAPIVLSEFTGSSVLQNGEIHRCLDKNSKNPSNKLGIGKWCRKVDVQS